MRTFAEVFHAHQGRLVDKWVSYFEIYQKHLCKYQDKPVKLLEIGVSHGGSLQIWKEYLGQQAEIMGIDIDPRCKEYEEDRIHILTYDQSQLKAGDLGPFDIVIDDGSHMVSHQEASFKALWPDTRGTYIVEDVHGRLPNLEGSNGLLTQYTWVMVVDRPQRLIRGKPSQELRQDEIEAINLYSDV